MQKTISDYLLSLGFIPNKCGYRYVFDLIYLATSGKEILPLKYVGYAEIAKLVYAKMIELGYCE